MSTKEEMKFYEGSNPPPRNKDCVTIKRDEYQRLLNYKSKLISESGDLKEMLREIELKEILRHIDEV